MANEFIARRGLFALDSSQITGSLSVTGSLTVNNSSVEFQVTNTGVTLGNISTDVHNATGSFNVSGSTRLNGNTTITGSLIVTTGSNVELQVTNTGVTLGNISTDIHTITGSFSVSGSTRLNGNTVVTGSLTTTGTIIAQTLNVQQVTSSVVFSSGSNVFGNSLANTQRFTGSMLVTGSLTVNGINSSFSASNTLLSDILTVRGGGASGGFGFKVEATNGEDIFYTNNFTYDVIANPVTGKFGIGTTSPASRLNVAGAKTNSADLTNAANQLAVTDTTATAAGVGGRISFLGAYTATPDYLTFGAIEVLKDNANNYGSASWNNAAMRFIVGNNDNDANAGRMLERMRITSGGNVGIGNSSPVQKLHVEGSATIGTTGTEDILLLGRALSGGVSFQQAASLKLGRYQNAGGSFESYTRLDIALRDNSASSNYNTNTTVMTLTNAGNVGIGTTTPNTLLNLKSSTTTELRLESIGGTYRSFIGFRTDGQKYDVGVNLNDLQDALSFNYAGTERMRITSGGSLQINYNPGGGDIYFRDTTNGAVMFYIIPAIYVGTAPFNSNRILAANSSDISFETGGAERIRIKSNGNIIIGPSSVTDLGSIMTVDGNINLTNGANRFIYIGSATNYNYQVRTEGDDFAIREAGTTDRLRYSYLNVRWTITGGLTITGSLSKGSGSFKIDHPLPSKKNTHHLVHSFIEGPQADNIYRGKIQLVNGKATINLDQAARMTEGTFVLLNGNIQCFTSNESGWTAVKGIVEGNILTIEAQDTNCADTISWLVVGERIDQHMLDTEWTDENGKVITEPLKQP